MPLNAAQPPKKGSLPDPKDLVVPPLTVEEEDAIIHTRITNDEKALRRVIKKFHSYATLAHPPAPSAKPEDSSSATEDAREAFLVELASFELTLKKSLMVCEAEARQVEEYERERARIADEHVNLRGQIDQLKTSLEHAQMLRKRKIEYDVVAEKINALPSRAELEQTIRELESDMSTIRVEHETQQRTMQAQQAALHDVVRSVAALRQIGKDADADAMDADVEADGSPGLGGGEAGEVGESGEVQEEREDGEEREGDVRPTPGVAGLH